MKILFSIFLLALLGCTSVPIGKENVDRESRAYRKAKKIFDRDAKDEFERNKNKGNLRFYAIKFHLENKCTIPGLSKHRQMAEVAGGEPANA